MPMNIRRFARVGVSLTAVLIMAACTQPPPTTTSPTTSPATSEATTAATSQATTEATSEATTEATSEATTEATSEATTEATSEATTEATSEATTEATSEVTPNATGTVTLTTEATGAMTPTAAAMINVGDSALGKILTDGEGRTLYVFTKDSGGTSACYGSCATNWPPLLTMGDPKTSSDGDSTLLGTTTRTDGTTQVTYKGMPLYYYSKDTAAGDTNGEEVGDVWYVVSPTGEMIHKS